MRAIAVAAAAIIVDASRGRDAETDAILARLAEVGGRKVMIINKVDLVARPSLLALAADLNARAAFESTFMISALSGDGVADLRSWLAVHVPPGPWHYPADDISDAPLRSLAAEITREKLYLRLHEELPYQSTVETDQWKQLKAIRSERGTGDVIYFHKQLNGPHSGPVTAPLPPDDVMELPVPPADPTL